MTIPAINRLYLSARGVISNCKPITIIRYHSISNTPDPFAISPEAFLLQAEFISASYPIVRLSQIKDLLSDSSGDNKRMLIFTFDDAYCDFFDTAYPILEKFSIPSTVFVPSGRIGKNNTWDSGMPNYLRRSVMNSRQLIQLQKIGLAEFGSHSVDHPSMEKLSVNEMTRQALESKATLEEILDRSITMFSYPYGHFSEMTTKVLIDSRYDLAVTSTWGTSNTSRKIMNLRRIYLNEKDTHDDIRAKIDGLHDISHIRGVRHIEKLGLKVC